MRSTLLIGLTVFSLVFSSCGILWEYRGQTSIENFVWNKSEVISHTFSIDESGNYDLVTIGQHITDFPYQQLDLQIELAIKDHTIEESSISIPLRKDNGEYLAVGSGDYWDFEHATFNSISLDPGDYVFSISSNMTQDPVQLISSLGVRVEKK